MNRRRQRNLPVRPHKHVRRANRDAVLRRAMPVFTSHMAKMARESGDCARLMKKLAEAAKGATLVINSEFRLEKVGA